MLTAQPCFLQLSETLWQKANHPFSDTPHRGNVSTSPRFLWQLSHGFPPRSLISFTIPSRTFPSTHALRLMPVFPPGSVPISLSLRFMPVYPSGLLRGQEPFHPPHRPALNFLLPLSAGLLHSRDRFSTSSVFHLQQLAASKAPSSDSVVEFSSISRSPNPASLDIVTRSVASSLSSRLSVSGFALGSTDISSARFAPSVFLLHQAKTPGVPTDRDPSNQFAGQLTALRRVSHHIFISLDPSSTPTSQSPLSSKDSSRQARPSLPSPLPPFQPNPTNTPTPIPDNRPHPKNGAHQRNHRRHPRRPNRPNHHRHGPRNQAQDPPQAQIQPQQEAGRPQRPLRPKHPDQSRKGSGLPVLPQGQSQVCPPAGL